jgi:polyketide synthase PksL
MITIKSNSRHLINILQQHASTSPNEVACLFLENGQTESGVLTYGGLHQKASGIAAYLKQKNLASQRVLLLYPTGCDFISAFMGCLYAGVVAVPVNCPALSNFDKSHDLLKAIAEDADIAGILTISDYQEKARTCFANLSFSNNIFIDCTDAWSDTAEADYEASDLTEDTLAYLQYTSGSTSAPKAAMISHANLLHSLEHLANVWRYSKKSITLTWAPHSHVYGLICGILTPLYHGTLAILMPASAFVHRPLNWLEAISKYQVTHSGGPNFGYDLCCQTINETEIHHLDLKSWQVACNGGEQVQTETITKFVQLFQASGFRLQHFCSAYGMSEMTGPIAVGQYKKNPIEFTLSPADLSINKIVPTDDNNSARRFVGNGRLMPGIEAIIVDPATSILADKNTIGEVWLAGKSVAQGYWRRPEETAQIFQATLVDSNQWYFRTGDLGFIENQELCLVGRLKEVIVLYGKKYYPLDLEMSVANALINFPITSYRAAFGITVGAEEKVVFLQEIKNDTPEILAESMIKMIRRTVSEAHNVDLYAVVLVKENTLPKTASGKLQRKKCQQLFLENQLDITLQHIKSQTPTASAQTIIDPALSDEARFQQDFIDLLASILNIPNTEIHLKNSVSEYGFDSIKIVKLSTELNQIYNFHITPAIIFEYKTVDQLLADLILKNRDTLKTYYSAKSLSPLAEKADHPMQNDTSSKVTTNDVAIIGMSGIFPEAENIEIFWENLLNGKDAIREIPQQRWEWEKYSTNEDGKSPLKWGGFMPGIDQFDAAFFHISPREAELMDPQQRLFLQTAWHAIEDAGYSTHTASQVKTGLFVGVFSNDYAELIHNNQISDAYITTGITHAMLANRVSYLLNLNGPSEAIDTACSSSLVAIHHAVSAIQNKECDMAIAGGVNALLTPTSYLAASKAGMLSLDGRCKTFDKSANGYARSEGVAAILLKSLPAALADGDHIYGVIKGTAVNHGGHVSSLTVPNPVAQADVIQTACQRAQISIERINYIETHGTGTSLGDPIEINGLKKAFSASPNILSTEHCGLGAVKTHIGHLESAAGMAGIIKVLLAMQHQTLPGNLHFNALNPYVELTDSPFYIVNQNQVWENQRDAAGMPLSRYAGVSSFGFGGTNAHVILEEAPSNASHQSSSSYPYIITLSAKTESVLQQRMQDLTAWLSKQSQQPTLSALSFTLNAGRDHFEKRCALVVSSIAELQETLHQIQMGEKPQNYIIHPQNDKTSITPLFESLLKQLIIEIQANTKYSHDEYHAKLITLSGFYSKGHSIDWEALHHGEKKRLAAPTYPFAKDRHWIATDNTVHTKKTNQTIQHEIKSDATAMLIQHIAALLKQNAATIAVTHSLNDLGFDSISYKELATEIEKTYQITLTPVVFFTHTTIAALSAHLQNTWPEKFIHQNHTEASRINAPATDKNTHVADSIAIIGMQAILPQSNNIETFWENILNGKDLITEIPAERWDWHEHFGDAKRDSTKTNSKWAGLINDFDQFDAGFFNISEREANLMDPQHRLFMEVVWKTIEDAGYDPFSFSDQDVGVFAGIEFNEYNALMHTSNKHFHGHVATGTSHALLSNRISYFFNLHGPSEVIDTACSSSLVAIHRAVRALQQGECTTAIAGGVSLALDPNTFIITSQLGALSADGRCKTFDKSANGYVKGEGVAALLLKPLKQAQRDGDHIYGVIKGIAVNHGGKAQSLTAPNALIQSKLLRKAYAEADIDIETITYIETHGTGTELGDPIEIDGLKQAFAQPNVSNKKSYCGLGSVKTNIGHLEPASGVAGVIKVLMAIQTGKIPGNLHFNELNPYIDLTESPFYIVKETMPWDRLQDQNNHDIPRRAGVSSFGFGGTNAHVLIEEYSPTTAITYSDKPAYLITLSAKNDVSLKQKIVDLDSWLKRHTPDLASLSYTLNRGRAHFNARAALVVSSLDELSASLQALIRTEKINNSVANSIQSINLDSPLFNELYKNIIVTLKNSATTDVDTYREKLLLFGDFYTKYYPIDWNILHAGETTQRIVGLPPYPFTKQRHWFDLETATRPASKAIPSTIHPMTINNTPLELEQFTQQYLKRIFSEKLNISAEKIFVDETYEVYGVDSLLGLEITNRLEDDFGTLPKTLLYERNYIGDLAKYFQQKFPEVLIKLAGNTISLQHARTPDTFVATKEEIALPMKLTVEDQDIAIIGLTGIYPNAEDIQAFWNNLYQGIDCITEIPAERWNYQDYPVVVGGTEKFYKYGGFIPDVDKFDPLFFGISPREAAYMDPQERLFMQSAWATMEDAGYTRESLQATTNNNVGVFAGVTYNFYPLFVAEEWSKGNRLPLDIQQFSVANRISYFLNLNGPSFVVDTACSSSLAAIHLACESIQRGECKMAIAGGVNLSLHPSKYHMLGSYSFLSESGRCTSFAAGGEGYVPSEGVGTVLLKPLAHAIKDNDRIYGVIKASSMNHGGKTSGYTVPNPNAQAALIATTLAKAKINPRTISYIEAHGTGTALGDPIEIRGLQEAFEQQTHDKQFCAIGSVKSSIGHLESAAGISQLTKVLLQMHHKKLVPSLHASELNPFIDFAQTPFFVQRELNDWQPMKGSPRRAGISSFGAGGTNIHLIVDEFEALPITKALPQNHYLFLLSATNAERLLHYARQVQSFLILETEDALSSDQLQSICYTSQIGRESMTARLAIRLTHREDLLNGLQHYIATESDGDNVWVNHTTQIHRETNPNLSTWLKQSDYTHLAKLWINGAKIPWESVYAGEKPQKTFIPTYPFAKRRCWIPNSTEAKVTVENSATTNIKTATPEAVFDWLYTTHWQKCTAITPFIKSDARDHWLIFSDTELGFLLQEQFENETYTYCFRGETYAEHDKNTFYINPENQADYQQLFSRLHTDHNQRLKGIIYLWPIDSEAQHAGLVSQLISVLQTLTQHNWQNKLRFCLASRNSQGIHPQESLTVYQHPLWPMAQVFAAEQSHYEVLLLDLDAKKELRLEASQIRGELYRFAREENHIAYRHNERFVLRLSHYDAPLQTPHWSAPETALITGGLGALGVQLATLLIKLGTKNILLTGRTALPLLTQEKVMRLSTLEKLNATVYYAAVNVADKDGMQQAIAQVELKWKKSIYGVFHLAGIATENTPIKNITPELIHAMQTVKITGAFVLHELFHHTNLNCFVLFSSLAALPHFGMSGLGMEAMSNAFLDGLAQDRRANGLAAQSINWSSWAEIGMSAQHNHAGFLDAVGLSAVSTTTAMHILHYLLSLQPQQMAVLKVDWKKFFLTNAEARKQQFFAYFADQHAIEPQKKIVAAALNRDEVVTLLIITLSELLDLATDEIDVVVAFLNYGLDSIIGINFVAIINEHYGEVVSPMDLYRYPTTHDLAAYIVASCEPLTEEVLTAPSDNTRFIENEEKFLTDTAHLSDAELNQLLEDELMELDNLT